VSWRGIALIAALYGLLAVALAALGAHLLPADQVGAQKLWATALQIHMFQAAALLALAALAACRDSAFILWSGFMMAFGVLLFSGSLYLRAAGVDLLPGPLTPLGGSIVMLGWVVLIITLMGKTTGTGRTLR
jgi:uncharacterized membrane protein YgdD (TMEM256/DUF423 family)